MHNSVKKILLALLITTMLIAPAMTLLQAHATVPAWNISGTWDVNFVATSGSIGTYEHIMNVLQAPDGTLSGDGFFVPAAQFTWVIDSGSYVSGNNVIINLHFTGGHISTWNSYITATVNSDGKLTGTWHDTGHVEEGGLDSAGTFDSIRGQAIPTQNYVPPGDNVPVNPDPKVGLTFTHVDTAGEATVDATTTPPEGYPPLTGIIGQYFNIHVTATFSGTVKVCIKYDDTGLTLCQEQHLRLVTSDGILPIGDVNHDGKVDLKDLAIITVALGSTTGKPRWNSAADLNNDGKIDFKDLSIAAKHFGESTWVDITTGIDTTNNIICGSTDHFSGFGVHK